MELWIWIAVLAAFLQNLRSTLQKQLNGVMSTTAATFVRFGFGVPVALAIVAVLHGGAGMPLPAPHLVFLAWACLGGLCQIAATFALLHLLSLRNFVVGNAYSRTEPALAALFGLLFLGDKAGSSALLAIALTIVGVMLVSVARSGGGAALIIRAAFGSTAMIGLFTGALFGMSAVAYRAASLSLDGPNFLMQAAFTLAVTILLQSSAMLAWIAWRERAELMRIAAAWRASLAAGVVGATASFGWFYAMTLQQAALVKAVAQIEIVFAILSSTLFFRERVNGREWLGTGLIVAGILALLLL